MSNTEQANAILKILRSEIAEATTLITGEPFGSLARPGDLVNQLRWGVAGHHARANRYAELLPLVELAEALGDIDGDATDDDAEGLLQISREHLLKARLASAPAPLKDPTDRASFGGYIAALDAYAASLRFAEILTAILGDQLSEPLIAGQKMFQLRGIVKHAEQLDRARDQLVRELMTVQPQIPRADIAAAAGLESTSRLYQIRDGRR